MLNSIRLGLYGVISKLIYVFSSFETLFLNIIKLLQ